VRVASWDFLSVVKMVALMEEKTAGMLDDKKVETMVALLVPSTVVMTVASLGLQLVVLKVGLMVGQKVALLV
jgi:hypothetical protein